MRYTIEIVTSARKSLRTLPREAQIRVRNAIDALAEDPYPPKVKKMEGMTDAYRIRIGEYRVVYEIQGHRLIILVLRIGHRRDVYR
jgi:mRNA interferase RelE/StbE